MTGVSIFAYSLMAYAVGKFLDRVILNILEKEK